MTRLIAINVESPLKQRHVPVVICFTDQTYRPILSFKKVNYSEKLSKIGQEKIKPLTIVANLKDMTNHPSKNNSCNSLKLLLKRLKIPS